ncbi:hypothetical protein BH10ACI1_BH10ACI1_19440 [soil metagenome]
MLINSCVISVTENKLSAILPPSSNLDQCANGPDMLNPIVCAGANWQNGNLNSNNSHYIEGESVSYRVVLSGLTPNSTGNTVTIDYDTTVSAKHAFDYLTTFDRTEAGSNPCSGVANCNLGAFSTMPIPIDGLVTGGGVTQIGGQVFTLYKGTITGVSAYTHSGSFAGTSQASLTITFSASADTDVVLAFGGHISTRGDWGLGNSAVSLNGSPYHMRADGGANRSISVDGILFPGTVTIIKEVQTFNGGDSINLAFPFTATNFGTANFSLVDNNSQPQDRIANPSVISFGAVNTITVTESTVAGWTLADLTCVETAGGLPNVQNSTTNLGTRTATIIVEEGENVTCTFKNLQLVPTAATASIRGQVLTVQGMPVSKAVISLFNASTSEMRTIQTNPFGYYSFEDLEVGNFYVLTINSKRYVFNNNTISFVLNENLENVNFEGGY